MLPGGRSVTINQSINQSINQPINHKALSSRATSRLKCYSNNTVRQSVKDRSEDEVWIRLSEEPCLEMLTEWVNDWADVVSSGGAFQMRGAATGKARLAVLHETGVWWDSVLWWQTHNQLLGALPIHLFRHFRLYDVLFSQNAQCYRQCYSLIYPADQWHYWLRVELSELKHHAYFLLTNHHRITLFSLHRHST